jgi:hypothetical protein
MTRRSRLTGQGVVAIEVEKVLAPVAKPWNRRGEKPFVILVVGVSSSADHTIGKLASKFSAGSARCAGRGRHVPRRRDRAAQIWGERNRFRSSRARGSDSQASPSR